MYFLRRFLSSFAFAVALTLVGWAEAATADPYDATAEPIGPEPLAGHVGSPLVPLDSWVYAAFDRLAALGYAPSAYANLRPWTRMECARIIAAARADLYIDEMTAESPGQLEAYQIYVALKAEFANELDHSQARGVDADRSRGEHLHALSRYSRHASRRQLSFWPDPAQRLRPSVRAAFKPGQWILGIRLGGACGVLPSRRISACAGTARL